MGDSYEDAVIRGMSSIEETYCPKHHGLWIHECGCEDLAKAWESCRGEWPEQLWTGVMFYNGRRITKQQFEEFGKETK